MSQSRARSMCVCVCCCCIVCIVRTQTYVMLCLSYLTRILSRSLYPPRFHAVHSVHIQRCVACFYWSKLLASLRRRNSNDNNKKSNNKTKTIKTILCRQIGTFWISFFLLCFSCRRRRIHACTQTSRCAESETANANARPLWPCACVGVLCVAFGTSSINMHARIHERARTHTHVRNNHSNQRLFDGKHWLTGWRESVVFTFGNPTAAPPKESSMNRCCAASRVWNVDALQP